MYKRIYLYPSVQSYNYHVSRFMKTMYQDHPMLTDLDAFIEMTDNDVLYDLKKALKDKSHPGHRDAYAILRRSDRFQAIPSSKVISNDELERIRKELQIPDGEKRK